MTVLIPVSRSWTVKVLPRSSHILTRLISSQSNTRVTSSQNDQKSSTTTQCILRAPSTRFQQIRSFADGKPGRPAGTGRPKAHTGREPAKRAATKKIAAKKIAVKTKPKTKAKAKAKPKPKKKAAAKPKAKPRTKKAPSERQLRTKASKERTALKAKALLHPPKRLPENAWAVFFVEKGPKKGEAVDKTGTRAKAASQEYRNMSAEERERLNHEANQNKAKNETAFKKWLSTYTPLQIKEANHARDLLRQQAKKDGSKKTYPHLKDERIVKQPQNQYSMFLKDRYDTGDMKGMTITEAGKLVAREWKDLSAAEKRAYDERYAVERNRYFEEHKTVYGFDSPAATASAATAA